MCDLIYEAFLENTVSDAKSIEAASDTVTLEPLGPPFVSHNGFPRAYGGTFRGIEHLVRREDGTIMASDDPIGFVINFVADYCRSVDRQLQFRVAAIRSPLIHPNCKGGILCLGEHFRPGTRLRPLVEQLYRIVSGRIFASDNGFDAEACSYYLSHLEQVRGLRSRPLWRRQLTARVTVAPVQAPATESKGRV